MAEYELPLVFFTVFCQWAIGSILAITVLCVGYPAVITTQLKRLPQLAIGVLLVTVIGSMLSTLHLGSPLGAYRAVLGIGHSWLSRALLHKSK